MGRYNYDFESHYNKYKPGEEYYFCNYANQYYGAFILRVEFIGWKNEAELNSEGHPSETNMPFRCIIKEYIYGELGVEVGSIIELGSKDLDGSVVNLLDDERDVVKFVFTVKQLVGNNI